MTLSRTLLLLLMLLITAACGPEAPVRANRPAPRDTQAGAPLIQAERPTLPTAQSPDLRTMGDPSAPIVVIEYGDYQ